MIQHGGGSVAIWGIFSIDLLRDQGVLAQPRELDLGFGVGGGLCGERNGLLRHNRLRRGHQGVVHLRQTLHVTKIAIS